MVNELWVTASDDTYGDVIGEIISSRAPAEMKNCDFASIGNTSGDQFVPEYGSEGKLLSWYEHEEMADTCPDGFEYADVVRATFGKAPSEPVKIFFNASVLDRSRLRRRAIEIAKQLER